MTDVVVTQDIPAPALPMLREAFNAVQQLGTALPPTRQAILAAVPGCRALVTLLNEPVDEALLDAAGDDLRIVANYAVGYDNIDVAAATARGIAVANTPGVLTDSSAELAIALLLAASRRVVEGDRMVREGAFHGWAPKLLRGTLLRGKTFGIIGAGRIGQATARIAAGFGMSIAYNSRRAYPPFEEETGAVRRELDPLLEQSDVVSLHMPLTPQTRHLIGREQLARMRSSAILINTARGPVVDEDALVEALRSGAIASAGLDVFEREPALADGLAQLPNVVLLPHLGSATMESRAQMAELTAGAVIDVLSGRKPSNLVNPEVWDHRRQ